MNLDSLMNWVVGVVIAIAFTGNLDRFQKWVWMAQARFVYEARTET